MALPTFTPEPYDTNTPDAQPSPSLSSLPTTKTMTTTTTPSLSTTSSPRRTTFSNSYSLRRDTTFTTSTRNHCTLYSAGSGMEYFSSICNSVYGIPTETGTGSTYSTYTPSLYDPSSDYHGTIIVPIVHPFAIWKIIMVALIGFFSLLGLIGGCFRYREKRRQKALAAAFPKEVQQLPSYGGAVVGAQTVGVLDQHGNVTPPATNVQNENVVQPAGRVHLRDEAGNVPPVANPSVRNVWPGLR